MKMCDFSSFYRVYGIVLYIIFFMYFFVLVLILLGDIEINFGFFYESVVEIIYLNVWSIRNKIDFFNVIVSDFDIVCFIEMYLDYKILDNDILLDGFDIIFCKDWNFYGGGVIIYISNNIWFWRCIDFELGNIECIWIEIDNFILWLFLCCVYCLLYVDFVFWRNFLWFLDKVSEIFDKFIVVGDINVDFFIIFNIYILYDVIFNIYLVNKIYEFIRIMNFLWIFIDLIFISEYIDVIEFGILNVEVWFSDYKVIYVCVIMNYKINCLYKCNVWWYKDVDFDKFNKLINDCDWCNIISNVENVNIVIEYFIL